MTEVNMIPSCTHVCLKYLWYLCKVGLFNS